MTTTYADWKAFAAELIAFDPERGSIGEYLDPKTNYKSILQDRFDALLADEDPTGSCV